MVLCPTYEADPSFQLVASAGVTGKYDCTAHSASDAIDHATCGAKDPGGRTIRLATNEPIPDPDSPGLNLGQVANVALSRYGVYLDVRTGSRAVTWGEYERRRNEGQGAIIQLSYRPIAATKYDAFGSRFFGGHAMFESIHATYDPGADGLHGPGRWKHDGSVYPRSLMRSAAGQLVLGPKTTVGDGRVWAAFTRDVIPAYRAVVPPGTTLRTYDVVNGVITGRSAPFTTGGFSATCTVPLSRYWPATRLRYTLVRLTSGGRKDKYIAAKYAHEV